MLALVVACEWPWLSRLSKSPYPSSHGVKALAEKERTGTSFQPLTTLPCTGHELHFTYIANLTCVDITYCCNEKNISHEIRFVATFHLIVSSLLPVSRSRCPDPGVQCCSLSSLIALSGPVAGSSLVPDSSAVAVSLCSLCSVFSALCGRTTLKH